jgi:hypothetical protein
MPTDTQNFPTERDALKSAATEETTHPVSKTSSCERQTLQTDTRVNESPVVSVILNILVFVIKKKKGLRKYVLKYRMVLLY